MTLIEWLNSPLYRDSPRPTVLERLAELVRVNGGFRVGGWGFISGSGLYGRHGLEQEEALELIHLDGVLTGFVLAGADKGEAYRLIEEEWSRQSARCAR